MPLLLHMQLASPEAIGARVRQARIGAGLTQQKLATDAGLAIRTLAGIEAGANCTVDTLQRIAIAAGVSVSDFLEQPTEAAS